MSLLPLLAILSGESLPSYVARLAQFHAKMAVFQFLAFLGLHRDAITLAAPATIDRLATLSGQPPQRLALAAIQPGDGGLLRHGRTQFRADFLCRDHITFCPACCAEDQAPTSGSGGHIAGQLLWQFAPVRTCPKHCIALSRLKVCSEEDRFQLPNLRLAAAGPSVERTVSPLQSYIVARLDGPSGPAWLDGQRIDQAAAATQLLGACLLYGTKVKWAALTEDALDAAGRVGFEAAARGETGIRDALATLSSARQEPSAPTPSTTFGTLFARVNAQGAEAGAMHGILRNVILETLPVATGETLLGQVVPQRLRHSATTLASEVGLSRNALIAALCSFGVLPKASGPQALAHLSFDAVAGERVAETIRTSIPVAAIPAYFNCDQTAAQMLVADGYATRIGADAKMFGKTSNTVKRVRPRRSMPFSATFWP